MAIDPNEMQLTVAQRQFIAELAARQGHSPQEVLADLITSPSVQRPNGSRLTAMESAHDLGQRLGLFAGLEDGPPDLSTNRRYMEGFGQNADRTGTD